MKTRASWTIDDVIITFDVSRKVHDEVTISQREPSIARRNKGRLPENKYNFRIGNVSWNQYVARLMALYGVYHMPAATFSSCLNERDAYIASPIPKSPKDFLAFCHELGHLLGRQHPRNVTQYQRMMLGTGTSKEVLEDEYHAWTWGLRYFRRLGFSITDDLSRFVDECFSSYTRQGSYEVANVLREKLNPYLTVPMQPHVKREQVVLRSTDKSWFSKYKDMLPSRPVGVPPDVWFNEYSKGKEDSFHKYTELDSIWEDEMFFGRTIGKVRIPAPCPQQLPKKDPRWNFTSMNKNDWRNRK